MLPPNGTRIEDLAGVVYLAGSASPDAESSHSNAGGVEAEAEANYHCRRWEVEGAADGRTTGNVPRR
jgi:hypothetical protein